MLPILANAQTVPPSWTIRGASLIDGTGTPPLPNAVITGVGDRITCVGNADSCAVPPAGVVLDATGKWIVPGLIDTHVHLKWDREGRAGVQQLLRFASGVTTTRDAGTLPEFEKALALKKVAEAPNLPEPRLVISGLVSDEELSRYHLRDFEDLVRKFAEVGADSIKVKKRFSPEEWRSIIAAAHGVNLPVWGHVNSGILDKVVDAGIDGLPHLWTFSAFAARDAARSPAPQGIDDWIWGSEEWNYVDEARLNSISDAAIKKGIWIEPELLFEKYLTIPYQIPAEEAYLGNVASLREIVRPWIPFGEQSMVARRARRRRLEVVNRRQCRFVKEFRERGGIVIAGTDNAQRGLGLADEVMALAECGLSPMDALGTATRHAAAAVRRPDLGTVESGKLADLLVLDGNPLVQVANLKRIWRVVKGGHAYDPAQLLRPIREAYEGEVRSARVTRTMAGAGLVLLTVGAVLFGRRLLRGGKRP
jgi:imidazolonepropionase-like amidohydrolase